MSFHQFLYMCICSRIFCAVIDILIDKKKLHKHTQLNFMYVQRQGYKVKVKGKKILHNVNIMWRSPFSSEFYTCITIIYDHFISQ